jgi:hypothetical protein
MPHYLRTPTHQEFPMSDGLKSAPPDPDAMRVRLDAIMWRWLAGEELTANQQLVVDMHVHAGGCHACG